jgi:hypothetical protein
VDAILARGELAQYHLAHAPGPISAGGWAPSPTPGVPTRRRCRSPSRRPSGASSSAASRSFQP